MREWNLLLYLQGYGYWTFLLLDLLDRHRYQETRWQSLKWLSHLQFHYFQIVCRVPMFYDSNIFTKLEIWELSDPSRKWIMTFLLRSKDLWQHLHKRQTKILSNVKWKSGRGWIRNPLIHISRYVYTHLFLSGVHVSRFFLVWYIIFR